MRAGLEVIIYNYPPKGRWIEMDVYTETRRVEVYNHGSSPFFTTLDGLKKCCFINNHNFFFWNFRETTRHFSLRSQNSEYPRIFQVTGANQNARKLLSTDLVKLMSFIVWQAPWTGKMNQIPRCYWLPERFCPLGIVRFVAAITFRRIWSGCTKFVFLSFLSQNILCDSKKTWVQASSSID